MKIIRPMEVTDAEFVSSTVTEADAEVYSASKYYADGDTVMVTTGDHHVYESLQGTAVVVTMTIATPCVITWTGSAPAADTPFQLSTTGALPTGLVAGTTYYVKSPSGSTSNVSATAGGAAINTTGSQSGVHTARHGSNLNKTPSLYSDPAASPYWLDLGATNRWRLFDQVVGQQCTNASSIVVVIAPSSRVNSLALFNLENASTVTVVGNSTSAGEVYNETFDLTDDGGITSWYAWYFESIDRLTELLVDDLPPYSDMQLTITIAGTGTVGCGEIVLGLSRDIGAAMYGTAIGIRDYSYKEQDDFGNWSITERAYANRVDVPVWVDGSFTDALVRLLRGYRATPVVWVPIDHVTSTLVYGFYKDFSVVVESYPKSICNLELEGLT